MAMYQEHCRPRVCDLPRRNVVICFIKGVMMSFQMSQPHCVVLNFDAIMSCIYAYEHRRDQKSSLVFAFLSLKEAIQQFVSRGRRCGNLHRLLHYLNL